MQRVIITVNIAHARIISKALDYLRSISKGELNRIPDLIYENNNTLAQFCNTDIIKFEKDIYNLKNDLINVEKKYFKRYLNILQLGLFGTQVISVKKKFLETCFIFKKRKREFSNVPLTIEELQIVKLACKLYLNLLCGNLNYCCEIYKFIPKMNSDICIDIQECHDSFDFYLEITSRCLNRKAKWCYDIIGVIDNIKPFPIRLGTLPEIKIQYIELKSNLND
jgi:hypothetical protein